MSFLSRRCGSYALCFSICATGSLGTAACSSPTNTPTGDDGEYAVIDSMIDKYLLTELTKFVAIPTFRDVNVPESETVANLEELRKTLVAQAQGFNEGQNSTKLESFEWKQPVTGEDRQYWVFGLRFGKGDYKLMLASHLDTVPPGTNPGWKPFEVKKEMRKYLGEEQEFYVGRGTIDDKGPAVLAFQVLKAVAQRYDGDPRLSNVTLELLFDTSEETDMSMNPYFKAKPEDAPDLGIIYDASWCVRAEKGVERPIFTIPNAPVNAVQAPARPNQLSIVRLDTPLGPTNQIPDTVTAVIGGEPGELQTFAAEVVNLYNRFPFDDSTYRRAKLEVSPLASSTDLMLTTYVEGAQHGSIPHENRAEGTNPLVSLANFLAGLVDQGRLARNEVGRMTQFIAWMWGTKVFGESHPDLLQRNDQVFLPQNGTTYALTRFYTKPQAAPDVAVQLNVDIRYAIGHHPTAWDGRTEGLLPGDKSIFAEQVWPKLIDQFNAQEGPKVAFTTRTVYVPDIRLTTGTAFNKVSAAYEAVMKQPCPALAIGGATDAKGFLNLLAAGALYTEKWGQPVNFHGFNEGAPVRDLKMGARILYKLLVNEIEKRAF